MENDLYSLCSYIIHFIAFYISFFAIRCLDIYVFEPILSCECGGCYSLAYCRFDPKQYRCVQTPLFVSIGSCFSSNTMIANPTTPRSTHTHILHTFALLFVDYDSIISLHRGHYGFNYCYYSFHIFFS